MTFTLRDAAIVLFALGALWGLVRLHGRPNAFRIEDLLLGPDGRASWSKITAIGAFVVAVWVMVALTNRGQMTEWIFAFFVTVYSGVPVAFALIQQRSPQPAAVTTTTTAPADATMSTTVQPKEGA